MNLKNKDKILITGCAGFIGMHLCKSLLDDGFTVHGVDNINDYYDINLKTSRLHILQKYENFSFSKIDITNLDALKILFNKFKPLKVVNLAAQAGVRYSIENPHIYIDTNISGFMNILECCRYNSIDGLIYASSSSVYGQNNKLPFSEKDSTDSPVSIYAASKKSNELMAKSYNEIYDLKSIGLRFFTVYGPWGRPDMAYYIFAKKIMEKKPIKIYNYGKMERDFTYISDIVSGIKSAINCDFNYEIINLGNSRSEKLLDMVHHVENFIGKKADISFEPMQLGDVKNTYADINKAKNLLNFNPSVQLEEGIKFFIDWYLKYDV